MCHGCICIIKGPMSPCSAGYCHIVTLESKIFVSILNIIFLCTDWSTCDSCSCFPANASMAQSNEQTTAVVPDLVIPGGESSKEASSRVADVVESLSPRSMRSTFAGMWSRTLRVKITGKDGTAKLDISIPVSH